MKTGEAAEAVADLAAQQWGLLTAAQAKDLGVSAVLLGRLVDRGVLMRVRHGVYASAATPVTTLFEIRAQWLALKPHALAPERVNSGAQDAVVSHDTAAQLHGIGDLPSETITFTTPGRRQTRQMGVRFATATLTPDEVVDLDGLPVTTVGRTLLDLASSGHEPGHLRDMLADALANHLATKGELANALAPEAEAFGASRNTALAMRTRLEELFPDRRADDDHLASMIQQVMAPLQQQLQEIADRTVPIIQIPSTIPPVQLPAVPGIDTREMISPALRKSLETQASIAMQGLGGAPTRDRGTDRPKRSTTDDAEGQRDESND